MVDCFSSFFSQSEATKESLAGFADTGRTIGKVFAAVIDFVTKPLQWIIGMIKDIFNFMTDSKLGKWISGKMGLGVGKKLLRRDRRTNYGRIRGSSRARSPRDEIANKPKSNNRQ